MKKALKLFTFTALIAAGYAVIYGIIAFIKWDTHWYLQLAEARDSTRLLFLIFATPMTAIIAFISAAFVTAIYGE